MNETPSMPEIDDDRSNALSVLGDPDEEFPVLKAFQQYIDAEQSKARKRMLALCIFFGCLLTVVVVIFLCLLYFASERNQALNDRMLEYAMKDRDRQQSPVVVQQPQADNSAILALTAKIEEMHKKLVEAQQRASEAEKARAEVAEKAAAEAAEAAKPKGPTPEELEIARLKALLSAEREKAEAERKRRHQEEIEAYRRKHYPELYEMPKRAIRETSVPYDIDSDDDDNDLDEKPLPKPQKKTAPAPKKRQEKTREPDDIDALIDGLDSNGAINYFDEESAGNRKRNEVQSPEPEESDVSQPPQNYAIPVEIRGSRSKWRIPND